MYKSLNPGHLNIKTNGFEETLALAKKHGFGAVSYNPSTLEAEGIDTYKALDLMGQYGVIISDFGLPVQITSRDAFNDTFPTLEKVARAAAKLGIHRCCTWMMSSSKDYEYAENFDFHVWMFRLIDKVLKDYDILFGVEFLGPKHIITANKYPFIHTIDGMLELCDAVGTGNMGLLLDSHHCYSSGLPGGEFAKYIRNEKDIVIVHINDSPVGVPIDEVKDSPRFYPGEPGGGGNDLIGFMNSLKSLEYTGPVVVEPFSKTLNGMSDNDAIAKIVSDSIDSVWPK
ncbi:MAG: sugar phosphate isomerase/epimerase [Clostridiales bacterium]|nr:sugar phosphate isomerase/epimerase [Clostridiales bacterium]